jgi:hypothetical protein
MEEERRKEEEERIKRLEDIDNFLGGPTTNVTPII